MSKARSSSGKLSLVTILSLGLMVLGIGFISWAMFGLWAQSDYSAFAAGPMQLTGDSTVPMESDPSLVQPAPDKPLYPVYPAEGDYIGGLTIPALELELPIFQGTGGQELKKGVGHFIQSVLPGEEDNSVLSGHRNPVFKEIGNLRIGDRLIVQTSAGTFTYEVNGTRIVHADDKTVIVPTDHAVLTLTTCYPFNTPGYYPDRYVVSSALVRTENSHEKDPARSLGH